MTVYTKCYGTSTHYNVAAHNFSKQLSFTKRSTFKRFSAIVRRLVKTARSGAELLTHEHTNLLLGYLGYEYIDFPHTMWFSTVAKLTDELYELITAKPDISNEDEFPFLTQVPKLEEEKPSLVVPESIEMDTDLIVPQSNEFSNCEFFATENGRFSDSFCMYKKTVEQLQLTFSAPFSSEEVWCIACAVNIAVAEGFLPPNSACTIGKMFLEAYVSSYQTPISFQVALFHRRRLLRFEADNLRDFDIFLPVFDSFVINSYRKLLIPEQANDLLEYICGFRYPFAITGSRTRKCTVPLCEMFQDLIYPLGKNSFPRAPNSRNLSICPESRELGFGMGFDGLFLEESSATHGVRLDTKGNLIDLDKYQRQLTIARSSGVNVNSKSFQDRAIASSIISGPDKVESDSNTKTTSGVSAEKPTPRDMEPDVLEAGKGFFAPHP
jgi:hypothetical protein